MDLVKNINNSLSNTLEVIVLLVVLVFLDGKGVAYEKRSQKSSAATSSSASSNVYTAQLYDNHKNSRRLVKISSLISAFPKQNIRSRKSQ